jgi:hypothetical protein
MINIDENNQLRSTPQQEAKFKKIIEAFKKPKVYVPALIILVLAAVGGSVGYQYYRAAKSGDGKGVNLNPFAKDETPTETRIASLLDGQLYPENDANRHALGIMIENHPESRPQSGLSSASVVYEAQAEGGITRFLAIFGPKLPAKLGPVRSARPYYLDWCLEYNCFYGHVGGSAQALTLIPKLGIKDLDQFRYGTQAYQRYPKAGIAIEHTMYGDPTKLYAIADKNGWAKTGEFPVITFKQDASTTERPLGQSVTVEISSKSYETKWAYDPTTNNYARSLAGVPHIDADTNKQIQSKVVIVQEVASALIAGEKGLVLTTVGTGKAKIFQDGKMIQGTWKKAKQAERTIFMDETGKEISYNPGQRWITVVDPGSKVTVVDTPAVSTTPSASLTN